MRVIFLSLLLLVVVQIGHAQEQSLERLAREATNQAVEADRLFKLGDFSAALPLYRAERESRAKIGDKRYEAYAYRAMGCCLASLNQEEEAILAFKDAKRLDLERDDPGYAGYDDLLIARTQSRLGLDAEVLQSSNSALQRLKNAADRDHELETRLLIAQTHIKLGRGTEAEEQLKRIVTLSDELDLPALQAETWLTQASLDRLQGRLGLAFERLSDAQATYNELGLKAESQKLESELAETLVDLGQFEAAEARFAKAAQDFTERGDVQSRAECLMRLASIRLDLKSPKTALEAVREARECFQTLGADNEEIGAIVVEAQAMELSGDRAGAYRTLLEAIRISDRIQAKQPEEAVRLHLLAAELAGQLKQIKDVEQHLARASKAAEISKNPDLQKVVADKHERLAKPSK